MLHPGYYLLAPHLHPNLATQQGFSATPYLPMPPQGYGQWPPYQGWPYVPYSPTPLPAPMPNEIIHPHTAAPAGQNTVMPAHVRVMPASAPATPRKYVNSQREPRGK